MQNNWKIAAALIIMFVTALAVAVIVYFSFTAPLGVTLKAYNATSESIQKTIDGLAESECRKLCEQKTGESRNLSSGPCLANPLSGFPDWVCDVAHNPRQATDDLPENQCSAYGGAARHFVEVDVSCKLIRAV